MGQEGRVSWDSHRKSLLFPFSSWFPLCGILGYTLELHCMYINYWGVAAVVPQNTASSTVIFSSQTAENKPVSLCMVHGAPPIRVLHSMFPFSSFLAIWEGNEKHKEKPPSLHYYFLFSKQGVLPCFIPHRVPICRVKLGVYV